MIKNNIPPSHQLKPYPLCAEDKIEWTLINLERLLDNPLKVRQIDRNQISYIMVILPVSKLSECPVDDISKTNTFVILGGKSFLSFSVNVLFIEKLELTLEFLVEELKQGKILTLSECSDVSISLPNQIDIRSVSGIDLPSIYSSEWKLDIGLPIESERSCMLVPRPFVGWAGFYVSTASDHKALGENKMFEKINNGQDQEGCFNKTAEP